MKTTLACGHKLLRFVYKVLKERSRYDPKKSTSSAATESSAQPKIFPHLSFSVEVYRRECFLTIFFKEKSTTEVVD